MYKCAIIGVSGNRAKGIAEAYKQVTLGKLAAISTRRADKLVEFGEQFTVGAQYTDYREMFARERPDLVHVNTPPTVRLEIFRAAEEANIPAVLVEKPLAVQGEDFAAIQEFARTSKVKIGINHQLHFHPRRQTLQAFVGAGKIGEIRFIDASAGMNLAYQGTHSLQAIGAFMPDIAPVAVFAQASGIEGLQPTPEQHFAPDQCVASIRYANGVSALLRCGANAPRVLEGPSHRHKRIAVYGTRGYVHWTMWSWETSSDGHLEQGTHDYSEEDQLGQAAMTDAMLRWMADDSEAYPLNIDNALQDFNVILGMYMSTLQHRPVELPVSPEPDLIAKLRRHL